MRDKFHREQNYLRISLTEACNLRCGYCMPGELPSCFSSPAEKMDAEEIAALAEKFIELGVKKIRLTGGEPLMRKDFEKIAMLLSAVCGTKAELAVSTNGVFVHRFIDVFKKAGIRAVNVSLDTLLPERFEAITRRNLFHQVLSNIHLLLQHDFRVKVNVVVMKNINDDEIVDFIRWTRDYPVEVRFIEFMPFRDNKWGKEKLVTMQRMMEIAKKHFDAEPLSSGQEETAKRFRVPGFEGSFGFITTMSEPFCGGCSRIRLTADGKLKNCLFSGEETDLLKVLRSGGDIKQEIVKSVFAKKEKWGGLQLFEDAINRNMISIGG